MGWTSNKSFMVLRKLIFAVALALLFALLGVFGGVGYHLYEMRELSFDTYGQLGYAEAAFKCSMMYDPLLYPYYWMVGNGQVNGSFAVIIVPDAYSAGGRPLWGLRSDRERSTYVIHMLAWGMLPNVVILLVVTIVIELVGRRGLYLVLLLGVVGFAVSELVGIVFGVAVGCFLLVFLLRIWRDNPIVGLWVSLWKG